MFSTKIFLENVVSTEIDELIFKTEIKILVQNTIFKIQIMPTHTHPLALFANKPRYYKTNNIAGTINKRGFFFFCFSAYTGVSTNCNLSSAVATSLHLAGSSSEQSAAFKTEPHQHEMMYPYQVIHSLIRKSTTCNTYIYTLLLRLIVVSRDAFNAYTDRNNIWENFREKLQGFFYKN